jgi:hypothetical protein
MTVKQLWSIIRGRRTNYRFANISWTHNPVDEMKRAAEVIAAETYIGICEAGFPIEAERCEFCGAGQNDKCFRREERK